MTTTQRAVTVAALLLVVAVAGFLYLRSSNTQADFPTGPTTTTVTAATTTTTTAVPTRTVTDPDDPTTTTTAVPTRTVTDPDDPTTTTTAATTAEPDSGDEPTTTTTATAEPDGGDEPATTTTTATTVVTVTDPDDPEKCVPASTTVQMPPEPDEWWLYDPELEWPVTDPGRLTTENVYPSGLIEDAVGVAQQVEAFWAWYMTWGHCQGAALDLSQADHRVWLEGDAVDQLMYAHHRFWQQRLPVWQDVWNREFETARDEQRNKLIYLDALRDLDRGVDPVGPSTLLYNPSDETSVWRYWGPIIRPVPNPTAPQRSGELILPDDILGVCDPGPDGPNPLAPVSWDCAHLGPAEGTALGDWDVGWYYDIPHEHAAWYVSVRTSDSPGLVRYDPDVHGVPTSQFGEFSVDGGSLRYLPATVADGAGWTDVVEALKPYRPEGFPTDPDGYQQMWRYDVGGGWWHKEMGQLVLLVPAAELVAWLEANGYDPQQMFAQGWPNPEEETLIRNTWGKDWDPTNPADWRNRLADGVGWLEQGVEIGDSGNLAADIEAAIHISAWMDWAYRARLRGDQLPPNDLTGGWYPSAWAPGVTIRTAQDAADATFAHRPDGWATQGGRWQGLYHQALADGYHPDAETGRLTHPALNPELAVWKEWAAAGEAERWLGFQAADGDLGPAPGDTWIPWYPEEMVPLENHYLLPEHSVAHWETVVDWWPEGGLGTPVHQPDWYHAFTVAGPYVAEAGGHMFETCLWATGGLFAAWSLPHPQLEDASQNVTWIVRGIADRDGRVVKLAEPVNRPCIDSVNRWQHEGQVPHRRSGVTNFDEYVEYLRTPIPEVLMERAYDPDTALWTAGNGHLVDLPSQLFDDGIITVHEVGWLNAVADAADSEPGVRALETSYEDWQQWETDAIETLRINYGGEWSDLPTSHYRYLVSEWLAYRQAETEGAANAFGAVVDQAELDTPVRYTDWVLGGGRSYPEEFMQSTYRIVSRHRQPAMHWMYNDGTAINVDTWNLPQSEWDRWAARREAETLHTGVLITPLFVRHWETDRTIPAGHISSAGVHNDWSWANVEMLSGSVDPDGVVLDDTAAVPAWTVYLTSCMEEGFPTFHSLNGWLFDGFSGFAPEASDAPVWAWPGVLTYGRDKNRDDLARVGWPRWTWANHPDMDLAEAIFSTPLPAADCAGIAAGNYTPDYIHPYPGIGNYPVWLSAVGDSPPESWFVTDSPFDE